MVLQQPVLSCDRCGTDIPCSVFTSRSENEQTEKRWHEAAPTKWRCSPPYSSLPLLALSPETLG